MKEFKPLLNPLETPHIHSGGSGITNFDKKFISWYLSAILEAGVEGLWIGPAIPFDSGESLSENHYALRTYIVSEQGTFVFPDNITHFWDIFHKIKIRDHYYYDFERLLIGQAS